MESHRRRLIALIRKEFYQIVRDISSILISVFLPLLMLFLYGFGVSLDLNHLRIGLVLEDTSPDARSFAESLTNSRYFEVTVVRDRRELGDAIIRGDIRGFVVVPAYFSQFRKSPGQIAPIQVIADGSETNTANFVQNYVRGAYQTWLQQEVVSSDLKGLPLVTLETRYWYNEQLESRNFLIPGSLAIIMTLIGTLLTALVVAREWERGTMEALMATPVGIVELVASKLISYFILAMISMTLCVSVAVLFYNVPLRGSIFVLAFVTSVFLAYALGIGLLISTVTKNQFVAAQIAIVTGFLPAFILSGFLFEISSMPLPIQLLTYLVPARYFVSCLQTLFLVGNVWPLLFFNVGVMLLLGSIVFFITARKTVKRLD
jgi:ABC-2 type transport system permease protein